MLKILARNKTLLFIFSILTPLAIGNLGALFTIQSVTTWYTTLNRPPLNPPNWIFGPVWTTLYVLMGIALYLVLVKGFKKKTVKAVKIFFLQLLLNLSWSIVFFGLHSIGGALLIIIVLWGLIFLNILKFYEISKNAGYLLVPYILWVTFATYLNFTYFLLNY